MNWNLREWGVLLLEEASVLLDGRAGRGRVGETARDEVVRNLKQD